MKESKAACSSSRPPKPNLKNKNFVSWTKAESAKQEDNIVSTDWHEKLKTIPPFLPAYGNKPVNMICLLSGEYGRLWRKERDDWYVKAFIPKPKEKDMMDRKKKIRREIKEARKAAEASIKERKERRVKELEAKAKVEAENLEKIKARVQKLKAPKLPPKTPKKSKEVKSKSAVQSQEEQTTCPEGWKPVELTIQCECSDHNKETDINTNEEVKPMKETNAVDKKETETENQTQESDKGCTMCDGYMKQLKEVQEAKSKMKEPVEEPNTENEKEEKAE